MIKSNEAGLNPGDVTTPGTVKKLFNLVEGFTSRLFDMQEPGV